MGDSGGQDRAERREGSVAEVFMAFLKLGFTSFGGPVAHLGYFRDEFVTRRRWLPEASYADLVALCQFLPGPASSQVGFALGMMRAGWPGAIAAFMAFTLPSALIMLAFAFLSVAATGPAMAGALHGLKVAAVAIVAQAVWGMAHALCPDRARATIAVAAVALMGLLPASAAMAGAILLGAAAGLFLPAERGAVVAGDKLPVTPFAGIAALALFAGLLVGVPLVAGNAQALIVFDAFFRAGAMVFGGGHVVLPLLEAGVVAPGWVPAGDFLGGYAAAQALPGPLFAFAAYLGAVIGPGPNGVVGAGLALVALFLPGFLLLTAALPFWTRIRSLPAARSAMQGANAAVVGVLGAALYDPVFTTSIADRQDFTLALIGLVALLVWKAPPWSIVAASALFGAGFALLS